MYNYASWHWEEMKASMKQANTMEALRFLPERTKDGRVLEATFQGRWKQPKTKAELIYVTENWLGYWYERAKLVTLHPIMIRNGSKRLLEIQG